MVHQNSIALLGVDVGFSTSRPTTGVAWLADGKIGSSRTYTDQERRLACLPRGTRYSVIAIDGPLLPYHAMHDAPRACERIFIRGLFQNRCKPGMSHFGTGLRLRQAARDAQGHFAPLADKDRPFCGPQVMPPLPVIEAFPNAFLGVLLSDGCFALSRPRKRKRFDWLYERAVEQGAFDRLLQHLDWPDSSLTYHLSEETDHEKRAALVCLLTAVCAAARNYAVTGDQDGGYFWLPPQQTWADWALEAYARSIAREGKL